MTAIYRTGCKVSVRICRNLDNDWKTLADLSMGRSGLSGKKGVFVRKASTHEKCILLLYFSTSIVKAFQLLYIL